MVAGRCGIDSGRGNAGLSSGKLGVGAREDEEALGARNRRTAAGVGRGVGDGGVLALLKYPFYPLFNFDNGMNLISKSLTILTSAQLLVVFTFAHIFWRYFVFAGF